MERGEGGLDTHPLIIAKDSSLEKKEAPGSTVTVSLPTNTHVECT